MLTLLIAAGTFVGYLVAYHTYGRWLSRRIFQLDEATVVPSRELQDDVDFVPTRKEVIFGHHFTSIAGTGPIVGPAIAVFWGWLPALLWVLLGSIFIGAVHDFGALVVSLRNRGQTVGEIAGRLITPRARVLFLLILFFALTVVLAIFGLVIASIFSLYPESVLSVWIALPLAVVIGLRVHRHGAGLLVPSLIALVIMYAAIWVGAYYLPIHIPASLGDPVIVWTVALLAYCFVASVLPVWLLLQPRDYINSHQLVLAMGLLLVGVCVAGFTGQADLAGSAPMLASAAPVGAPPIWPFLFITIACGACSGFHCLVSSGTSSKQLESETDAQYVGYGAMLLEGGLAVLVILACCAGVGMGKFTREGGQYVAALAADGTALTGRAAWELRYNLGGAWGEFGLAAKVGAFVEGGANFLSAIGIPLELGIGMIAVLVASFAATTLDTATRLQRYVIQELAVTLRLKPLTNMYAATGLAVVLGGALAMLPGGAAMQPGRGGLILWPLFGATNQLLAGLAFMVLVFYLRRRNKPIWFAVIPMIGMLAMPAWALTWQLFNGASGWCWPLWSMLSGQEAWAWQNSHLLFAIGLVAMVLQAWMVIEAVLLWPRVQGVLEEGLPPLEPRTLPGQAASATLAGGSGS